jgi:hypothetical protein
MQKSLYLAIIAICLFACAPSEAQQTNTVEVSPKLREFLVKHPIAHQALTNVLLEAFSNRTVQIFYFYTSDASAAKAAHYYPTRSTVFMTICENQPVVDEFIMIVFESLNSEAEPAFLALFEKARSGEVSKAEFAREMIKIEFKAMKRTRDLLPTLKFSKSEKSKSGCYDKICNCPDNVEDFPAYVEKNSTRQRNAIKEYEDKYDLLRPQKAP